MTAKKTAARQTRTKSEVESDLKNVKNKVAAKETVDGKTEAAAKQHAAAVKAFASGISPEAAANAVTKAQFEVQSAMAGINQQLIEKAAEVQQLSEARDLLRSEIETLHDIDTVQTALDVLVAEYEEKTEALESEYTQKSVDLHRAYNESAARMHEEELAATKARAREKEEYEYKRNLERRNAEDQHNQWVLEQKRNESERQLALKKNWEEREEALKKAEGELNDLRAKVAGFDEVMKREVDKHVAIATNSLKKDLETKFSLDKKDFETKLTVEAAARNAIQAENNRQAAHIKELEERLKAAEGRVQSIAEKAIDGASKRDSLEQLVNFQSSQRDQVTTVRGKS